MTSSPTLTGNPPGMAMTLGKLPAAVPPGRYLRSASPRCRPSDIKCMVPNGTEASFRPKANPALRIWLIKILCILNCFDNLVNKNFSDNCEFFVALCVRLSDVCYVGQQNRNLSMGESRCVICDRTN
jgi:hypothetical protein